MTEIETLAAACNDVGATVTPLQIMTMIVLSLPPSYKHFISNWNGTPTAEKTIALLTSRLLKEENMAKHWTQEETKEPAFVTKNSSQPSS